MFLSIAKKQEQNWVKVPVRIFPKERPVIPEPDISAAKVPPNPEPSGSGWCP